MVIWSCLVYYSSHVSRLVDTLQDHMINTAVKASHDHLPHWLMVTHLLVISSNTVPLGH